MKAGQRLVRGVFRSTSAPAASASSSGSPDDADPFGLRWRFVREQSGGMFARALGEIQDGCKRSCWMWFVFPTAPWVVNGREKGSMTNRRYALRDLEDPKSGTDAARAYLRFQDPNVDLRGNYLAIALAVADQLERGIPCTELMGFLDAPKLKSSLQLFFDASKGGFDEEIHAACARALRALDEEGSDRNIENRSGDGGDGGDGDGAGASGVGGPNTDESRKDSDDIADSSDEDSDIMRSQSTL